MSYSLPGGVYRDGTSVRFRLLTDGTTTDDGVYVDDVRLSCSPPTFQYGDGTSAAAPYVSGAAALLWGEKPPGNGGPSEGRTARRGRPAALLDRYDSERWPAERLQLSSPDRCTAVTAQRCRRSSVPSLAEESPPCASPQVRAGPNRRCAWKPGSLPLEDADRNPRPAARTRALSRDRAGLVLPAFRPLPSHTGASYATGRPLGPPPASPEGTSDASPSRAGACFSRQQEGGAQRRAPAEVTVLPAY